MDKALGFLAALANALAQSAPYVVIGYMVAALIKEFVPLSVFLRYFRGGGIRPLLRAVGVGALLPICSCGVIPVGVGAFRCGASRGTTLAFITSGPTISPVAVLLAFSLLGPKLGFCFVVTALVGALVIGAVGNRCLSGADEDALRATRTKKPSAKETLPGFEGRSFAAKLRAAAKWAFWDLGTDISVDLLIGLSIAAGLLALLPDGWVASWLGEQRVLTLVYVIIVGIPLYTCTVPSIPVVQSLLLLGMSPGAAVAYMISGPATNLGEVNVLRRQLGGRAAVVFVGGLIAAALAGGVLTDWLVFPDYRYSPDLAHAAGAGSSCCVAPIFGGARNADWHGAFDGLSAWQMPFAAALGAAIAVGLARRGHAFVVGMRTKRVASETAASPEIAEAGR